MEFRNNIIFSAIAHAMIFMAALAMAGRKPAPLVPVRYVAVTLLDYVAAEKPAAKKVTEKEAAPPRAGAPVRLRDAAPPEVPLPPDVRKKPAAILPTKKDDLPRKNPELSESGPVASSANSIPGETGRASSTSGGIMDIAISAAASTRQAAVWPNGDSAGGSAGMVGAIRNAIERAKNYPPLARRRGIEGTVTTEFTINASGYPENIRIVQSSGYEILDSAARKTLLRASPYPPMEGTLEVPITFRLDGEN